jgi:MFS family permease
MYKPSYPASIVGSLSGIALLIVVGQFVIGLGAGSCYIISFVIISDLFSDSMRQTGILAVSMAWGIG